jgi:hypothetical protein
MIVAAAITFAIGVGAMALTAGIAVVLVRVLDRLDMATAPGRDRPDDGPGGGDDTHRLPHGSPDPGGEAPWWPDFERQFARYVAARHGPTGSVTAPRALS